MRFHQLMATYIVLIVMGVFFVMLLDREALIGTYRATLLLGARLP